MNKIKSALRIIFALGLAWAGLSAGAVAAPDPNLRPTAPYVAPVAENADWVLRIVSAQVITAENAPSADVLKEIHLTQSANLRRAILVATDGTQQEFYHLKGYNIFPTSVAGQVMVSREYPTSDPYPYYAKGFYGVDWIKIEFYTGVEEYKETQCFHYKGEMADPLASIKDAPVEPGSKDAPLPSEAWIDCKTKLPVAVRINGNLIEYVHNPAPADLVMSPVYEAAWKIQANQLSRINALKVVR